MQSTGERNKEFPNNNSSERTCLGYGAGETDPGKQERQRSPRTLCLRRLLGNHALPLVNRFGSWEGSTDGIEAQNQAPLGVC
jgi:hypothetical protein